MTTTTSVTVRVPLTIRRRGGRKMIISADGVASDARSRTPADIAVTRGDPALVKALARAFRWQRMLEMGAACLVSDIARQEKITTSYVSRVLRLTLLAPDIVEAVLEGRQAPGVTLPALLEPFPMEWDQQSCTISQGLGQDPSSRGSATNLLPRADCENSGGGTPGEAPPSHSTRPSPTSSFRALRL